METRLARHEVETRAASAEWRRVACVAQPSETGVPVATGLRGSAHEPLGLTTCPPASLPT